MGWVTWVWMLVMLFEPSRGMAWSEHPNQLLSPTGWYSRGLQSVLFHSVPPTRSSVGSGFSLLVNYHPGLEIVPSFDGGLSHEADGPQLPSSQISETACQPPAAS